MSPASSPRRGPPSATPSRAVSAAHPTAASAGPEPGRQRRDAGGAEGRGQEPVEQGRRLEVRHAVDPRHDPVAVERHLARDRGVETLRRIEERGGTQPDEVEADRDEGDAEGRPRTARAR